MMTSKIGLQPNSTILNVGPGEAADDIDYPLAGAMPDMQPYRQRGIPGVSFSP